MPSNSRSIEETKKMYMNVRPIVVSHGDYELSIPANVLSEFDPIYQFLLATNGHVEMPAIGLLVGEPRNLELRRVVCPDPAKLMRLDRLVP